MLDRRNYRGQVGETMTWMVGTLVIIVILIVSIFIVSGLDFFKDLRKIEVENDGGRIAGKSLLGYLLTEDKNIGEPIYVQLEREGEFNPSSGKFGLDVFKGIYEGKGDYSKVWVGFFEEKIFQPYDSNDYFGMRVATNKEGKTLFHVGLEYVSERVKINEDKRMEVMLIEKAK